MLELITDRTQQHVALLNRLRKKPWSSMTASEQNAWYGDAAKGAYNYTDLNRVESAVGELAGLLGLSLVTKTNWTVWDIPMQSDMERYLSNVEAIRDACPKNVELPILPSTMNGLTYDGANRIEEVLLLVYRSITEEEHECVLGEFILGECVLGGTSLASTDYQIQSGEVYCGEVV